MLTSIRKAITKRTENGEQGFTLVELIVVVAILAILAAIAIPSYGKVVDNARKQAVATQASSAATAIYAALTDDDDSTTAETAVANIDKKKYKVYLSSKADESAFNVAIVDAKKPDKISAVEGPGTNKTLVGSNPDTVIWTEVK